MGVGPRSSRAAASHESLRCRQRRTSSRPRQRTHPGLGLVGETRTLVVPQRCHTRIRIRSSIRIRSRSTTFTRWRMRILTAGDHDRKPPPTTMSPRESSRRVRRSAEISVG